MTNVALQVALVVFWSTGFIGAVLADNAGAIYGIIAWRFILFSLLVTPFVLSALPSWSQLRRDLCVGATILFAYMWGVCAAVENGVPAGTVALITALQPLATAAVTNLIGSERASLRQWLGLAVGLAGVAIVVGADPALAPLIGYAAAFLGMAAIVAGSLYAKADTNPQPVLSALWIRSAAAGGLFLALAAAYGEAIPPLTGETAFALSWWIGLTTLCGYGAYFLVLKRLTATRTASLIYLSPPVTAVFANLMFGDPIGAHHVTGFVVCMVGVLLASTLWSSPKRETVEGRA